jgi:hypothetical protein
MQEVRFNLNRNNSNLIKIKTRIITQKKKRPQQVVLIYNRVSILHSLWNTDS